MHRWDWFPTCCISQVKTGSYTEKDSDNNTTIEKMIMKKGHDSSWKLQNGRCWTRGSSLDHTSKKIVGRQKMLESEVAAVRCQWLKRKVAVKCCLKELFLRFKGLT